MRDFCHEAPLFFEFSRCLDIESRTLQKKTSYASIYFTKLFSTHIYIYFSHVSLWDFIVSRLM